MFSIAAEASWIQNSPKLVGFGSISSTIAAGAESTAAETERTASMTCGQSTITYWRSWALQPLGASMPAATIFSRSARGTGSSLNFLTLRRE